MVGKGLATQKAGTDRHSLRTPTLIATCTLKIATGTVTLILKIAARLLPTSLRPVMIDALHHTKFGRKQMNNSKVAALFLLPHLLFNRGQ